MRGRPYTEVNFDGLVGPTHHYGGLSTGNLASTSSTGDVANPRAACLQGIDKMLLVQDLGVQQGLLPPRLRPAIRTLHSLGYRGSPEEILAKCAKANPWLLSKVSSSSFMWSANAATVSPSSDTRDGRLHLTPANLVSKFHRSIEADETFTLLQSIFSDASLFQIHAPLPPQRLFSDEGAANHTRLFHDDEVLHLFAYGQDPLDAQERKPSKFIARQTRQAFEAIAMRHGLNGNIFYLKQCAQGIDGGSFHTDVLAVGSGSTFLVHEHAFEGGRQQLQDIQERAPWFRVAYVHHKDLPLEEAIQSYLFNSQLLHTPEGQILVAPKRCEAFQSVLSVVDGWVQSGVIQKALYVDVHQSMKNGGGPACLRLRVPMSVKEMGALSGKVLLTTELATRLKSWCVKYYRDRLERKDLEDPQLWRTNLECLEALYALLELQFKSTYSST